MSFSGVDKSHHYYGWNIVAALAITETISYGVLYYAFGVFIEPMEKALGWTRPELTGAFSLALLISAITAIPVGNWLDKYGARALMTIGSIAATILLVAWAFVQTQTQFYLIQAGIGMCMAMLFYDPAFTVVAKWFNRYRTRALTAITLVAGFASTIFLPLSGRLVVEWGWRGAILMLALIVALITIPLHVLVLRRSPADMQLFPDGMATVTEAGATSNKTKDSSMREALRNARLWWMILAFSLLGLATGAIRLHFIPLLLNRGFDMPFAAGIAGLIGAMQVGGRVIFAPIERRVGTKAMTMLVFGLQFLVLCLLVNPVRAEWLVGLVVAGFGASIGMNTLIRPLLLADTFGTMHYGRINSVMSFFMILSGTIAPVGAGILYEQSGNYQSTIIVAIMLTGLAILALSRLTTVSPVHE